MQPTLRQMETTEGADSALGFRIVGSPEMDEELHRGFCLPRDLQGALVPCGESPVDWRVLQQLLVGSVREALMTVTTTTRPAAIADAVMKYAARVSKRCSEADVYLRRGSDDPSLVDVAVIAPRWDLALLEDLQTFVFSDDVRKDGVLLDATVYFADAFVPDLSEYTRVA